MLLPQGSVRYNRNVSNVSAQASSRSDIPSTLKRSMWRNRIPPNSSIMSFKSATPLIHVIVSHPRSGGAKGGVSVRSFPCSSGKHHLGPKRILRSSRCRNIPMKYRICRCDPLGLLKVRDRTVGSKCLKHSRTHGLNPGMSNDSISSSWTLVNA